MPEQARVAPGGFVYHEDEPPPFRPAEGSAATPHAVTIFWIQRVSEQGELRLFLQTHQSPVRF